MHRALESKLICPLSLHKAGHVPSSPWAFADLLHIGPCHPVMRALPKGVTLDARFYLLSAILPFSVPESLPLSLGG